MENAGIVASRRAGRTRRRHVRGERIEAALVVALAGLVLFKGLAALGGIVAGIAEMMLALTRL